MSLLKSKQSNPRSSKGSNGAGSKELNASVNTRFAAWVLVVVAIGVLVDLILDVINHESGLHLSVEALGGLLAVIAAYQLFTQFRIARKNSHQLANCLEETQTEFTRYQDESRKWIEGLSASIDAQMKTWALTPAEGEVALLLLKGLSIKDVAEVRGTSEKTARHQSLMVYQKSGLSGRAELAAFFLEDLLTGRAAATPGSVESARNGLRVQLESPGDLSAPSSADRMDP